MKSSNFLNFIFIIFLGTSCTFGQVNNAVVGVRAGLNYASNDSFNSDFEAVKSNPLSSSGFHVGIYRQYGQNSFFFRPEILFTSTLTKFDEGDLKSQSIDIPLNLGMKILGPIYIQAGPVLQNLLQSEYADRALAEGSKRMRVLANYGAGISLGNLKIELRYERGLTDKEFSFLQDISEASETRVTNTGNQFSLSMFIPLSR